MRTARFNAPLLDGHKGAAVEVPFDPSERWQMQPQQIRSGRRGHPIEGSLNGVRFESAIVPRARSRH